MFKISLRNIFLDAQWKVHSLLRELVNYPPQGYEFVYPEPSVDRFFTFISELRFSYLMEVFLEEGFPLVLIKSYLDKFLKKPPNGVDLTYSFEHLVFREEPWVLHTGDFTNFIGGDFARFKRYKKIIERVLSSRYCKAILCQSFHVKKLFLLNLDCSKFMDKLFVVHIAVRSKDFIKRYNDDKVKLLFVNSANTPGQFEAKGGLLALEAFNILCSKYDNIELVIRSDVSNDVTKKYSGLGNVRFIEKIIPWKELEREFMTADIFFLPSHHTPGQVILDAMSYELPIITTDSYANSELVEEGKTGFLIKKSEHVPYYRGHVPNINFTRTFMRSIKKVDPEVVGDLVKKTSVLIEDATLRRDMGRAARWEVERGKFSIEQRNEKLKRIFDQAVANDVTKNTVQVDE